MKTLKSWAAAAAMMALTGTAQATLIDQNNGTVLDDTTNLIWLQDWNVNGQANWSRQMAWAGGLDFAGSTDWRLPSIDEYGDLFDEYGNLTLVTEFTDLQSNVNYWSGTEFNAGSSDALNWSFFLNFDARSSDWKVFPFYAVAVRPRDVAAVPEPQTLALVLMALGALVVARRRRQHANSGPLVRRGLSVGNGSLAARQGT